MSISGKDTKKVRNYSCIASGALQSRSPIQATVHTYAGANVHACYPGE